ncbi:hypothetical protein [Bacillus sp. ISL-47]|uniref:hypothetical protein n=1 Tax=Bacillus sp. ISL-47 TaxID=2819130 RepID=UPI002035C7C0|nr:hypothetical protein [Bacillus sp. ISL-47]
MMTLYDLIEELNTGKTISEIAAELGIRELDLERKVKNAAIVFEGDKKVWKYLGNAAEESLCRPVKSKIYALEVDRPFINNKEKYKKPKQTIDKEDYEYRMYKEYLNIDPELLTEKKTFFLSEEIYKTIKHESKKKSLKINVLLNLLLIKGLEHYKIDFIDIEKEDNTNKENADR